MENPNCCCFMIIAVIFFLQPIAKVNCEALVFEAVSYKTESNDNCTRDINLTKLFFGLKKEKKIAEKIPK